MTGKGEMLSIFVFEDWERIKDLLGILQKDMRAALRTATRQAGQWANREGARGLAKASNVPLKVLRAGVRLKYGYKSNRGEATARLWYGLNAISAKYLGIRQQKTGVRARGTAYRGGFVVGKLGGHAFQRVGASRYPIKKIKYEINDQGQKFLGEFEGKVAEKFVEFFFAALDKVGGREAGESMQIAGGINIAQK